MSFFKKLFGQEKNKVRQEYDSIRGVISSVAERKSNAAKARFSGKNESEEHSHDVYAESCSKIASCFVDDGFKYAKSGPHFSKKLDIWKYQVGFHTSHHNIPGEHVALCMYANVRCSQLKKWRLDQPNPYRSDDWVAGGMVHLLNTDKAFIEWELADPQVREDVIADAVSFVRTIVLPYFAFFEDSDQLIAEVIKRDIPEFTIGCIVEFALCNDKRDAAQSALSRYVTEHPELIPRTQKAEQRIEENGLQKSRNDGYAGEIAWLRKAYNLE